MEYDGTESLFSQFFKSKWIWIIVVLNLVLVIVMTVLVIIRATKSSTIVFSVAPIDATISVNGDTNYSNGSHPISPGHYEIQISHQDLQTKSLTLDIKPDTTVTLSTFLSDAEKTFNFYTLKKEADSMLKLQEIASKGNNLTTDHDNSAENFVDNYRAKLALLDLVLPIKYTEYEVSHDSVSGQSIVRDITIRKGQTNNCETTLCIEALMALTDDMDLINRLLQEKGINLDEYEIVRKTY